MSPRVTIHMPTYNQGRFIAHALEGALNQTYDDYRVIVSNNHSTDETDAVLARYAGHPRLTIIKPPTFLPQIAHFKFVVAQSDSEYFSYLCTDDGLFPDFLKEQVALLDRYPQVGFVHSAAEMIGKEGERLYLEKSIRPTGVIPAKQAFESFIYNAKCVGDSVLFRRKVFDSVGGFGDLYTVDWEIELLMCAVADIAYNQNVLMQYRLWDEPARTVPNQLRLMKCINDFYDKYEPRFPDYRTTFAKARRQRALGSIDALPGMNPEQRATATAEIRRMSPSPLVEAKLRAFEHGLDKPYLAYLKLRHRARNAVKAALYPILAPNRGRQ